MERDKEVDLLLKKEALKLWFQKIEKSLTKSIEKELSKEEIINLIKKIVEGPRSEEIINIALELYGSTILEVFKKIVYAYLKGKIGKLSDVELYEILTQLGFKIPLKTRVKIVRRGEEKSIGEELKL